MAFSLNFPFNFFQRWKCFIVNLKKKRLETHSWSDVPLVLMYVSLSTCYQATRRITSGEPVVEYKGTLLSQTEAKVRPDLRSDLLAHCAHGTKLEIELEVTRYGHFSRVTSQ